MEAIKVTGTIPNPERPGSTYQISFIGDKTSQTLLGWMQEIIDRGGVYAVTTYQGGK